ncbi:MAG TPA: carboxypeptidase-like regulatory domain-containing protein [Pyrinomonadaceae bacterium]|nr:carboxypeptidase-like regulatory domain-containing protein [Pyrinomonadaceae bacterium]
MSLTARTISSFIAALALCLFVQSSGVYGQSPATPVKTDESSIRGVVTYSDTGHPVRYAGVRLLSNETGKWDLGVTNRRGEFFFDNVAPGRYILFADFPGILKPSMTNSPGSMIAKLRLSGEAFTEAIVNGTGSVEINIRAVRGGVITGRVVTEDDQPLANAEIRLLKRENGKWVPQEDSWSRYSSSKLPKTDPSGVYRIAGLAAGEYLVRVSEGSASSDGKSQPEDGAYTNGFLMAVYYPAATNTKEAQTVTVLEGSESTGVDIRMPEFSAHKISGRLVFGPDNEPAASAQVLLERADEIGYSDPDVSNSSTRTDSEGKWEIQAVPAGQYVIRIGGWVQVRLTKDSERTVTVGAAPKRIPVRVGHDDVVVPDIKVSRGSSISGKVTLDGNSPKGFSQLVPQAVPESQTSANAARQQSSGRFAPGIVNGFMRDGTFSIHTLMPGKYSITVSGSGPKEYYVKSVTRKDVDLTRSLLKVGEESAIEDVVIALATDFATVEGQLTRPAASSKLDLSQVVIILAAANDATRRFGRGLISAQADASGKFIMNCPPGEYFLTAVTPAEIKKLARPIDEDYFKRDNQRFQRVKVKAGEKLTGLTIPAGAN